MAGDFSEDVLRDLLLEHGIEGVTLWHIKTLAMLRRDLARGPYGMGLPEHQTRLISDLRGEEAVLADAWAEWSLRMQPPYDPEDNEEYTGWVRGRYDFRTPRALHHPPRPK